MVRNAITKQASVHGHPWWVCYGLDGMLYEVQVNPKTKRLLIGFGFGYMMISHVCETSSFLEGEYNSFVKDYMSPDMFEEVYNFCKLVKNA